MLPDEMEAEKNRKIIVAQADEIDILKRNVRDLQGQLNDAHKRIAYLKERCNFSDVESHYMDNSIIVEREEV